MKNKFASTENQHHTPKKMISYGSKLYTNNFRILAKCK